MIFNDVSKRLKDKDLRGDGKLTLRAIRFALICAVVTCACSVITLVLVVIR